MSIASRLIEQARADGLMLIATDTGNIRARGSSETVARWVPVIREHKAMLLDVLTDDRRHCAACVNLNGNRCVARDCLVMDEIPRRCFDYQPKPDDRDQRPGAERWPSMRPEAGQN